MEKFPDALKLEISKNKQAAEALTKLESKGNLSPFWNILYRIFEDESKSIIHKLSKTLEASERASEFPKNYEKSLSSFKDGMFAVIQMMINNIYMSKSLPPDFGEPMSFNKPKQLLPRSDTNETEGGIVETQQHQKSYLSILSEQSHYDKSFQGRPSNKVIDSRSRKRDESSDRYNQTQRFSSADNPEPERIKIKSTRGEKTRRNSPELYLHLPKLDNSGFVHKSRQQDAHFKLQSEFNHIKGAVRFNQSRRKPFMKESTDSPGPANYSFEVSMSPILKRYAIATFGRETRKTSLGTVGINDSPGPGLLYPSKHLVLK